jgi:uncharacterized membrane protein (DUF2068 family)
MEAGPLNAGSQNGGKSEHSRRPPGAILLRLIGVFKLAKAVVLLCGGIAAVAFSPADLGTRVAEWVRDVHLDPGAKYLRDGLAHLTGVPAKRLHELGVAMFIYSALFLTEGIGLLCLQHWAEWVALVSTAGLIPLELYELYVRLTIIRGGILAINVAVVAYLLARLLRLHIKPSET